MTALPSDPAPGDLGDHRRLPAPADSVGVAATGEIDSVVGARAAAEPRRPSSTAAAARDRRRPRRRHLPRLRRPVRAGRRPPAGPGRGVQLRVLASVARRDPPAADHRPVGPPPAPSRATSPPGPVAALTPSARRLHRAGGSPRARWSCRAGRLRRMPARSVRAGDVREDLRARCGHLRAGAHPGRRLRRRRCATCPPHDAGAPRSIRALMERTGLPPEAVDDVLLGHCYPTMEAPAIGRVAALDAGLPVDRDRACRSTGAAARACRPCSTRRCRCRPAPPTSCSPAARSR